MEHTDFDGIIFADTLQDFNACGIREESFIFFAAEAIWALRFKTPVITLRQELM